MTEIGIRQDLVLVALGRSPAYESRGGCIGYAAQKAFLGASPMGRGWMR